VIADLLLSSTYLSIDSSDVNDIQNSLGFPSAALVQVTRSFRLDILHIITYYSQIIWSYVQNLPQFERSMRRRGGGFCRLSRAYYRAPLFKGAHHHAIQTCLAAWKVPSERQPPVVALLWHPHWHGKKAMRRLGFSCTTKFCDPLQEVVLKSHEIL
jgi:hypothetical protein